MCRGLFGRNCSPKSQDAAIKFETSREILRPKEGLRMTALEGRSRVSSGLRRFSIALQQLPRNNHALDLARPLADCAKLYIAVVLLRGIVLDEPIAAMNLNAFIRAAHRNLTRVEFGHRRFLRCLQPRIFHRGSTQCEQTRRIDFSRHVRELPLDRLKVGDWTPKLLALFRIFKCSLEGTLGDAEGESSDGDSSTIEHTHRVDESIAFFSYEILRGNDAVFEDEFCSVASTQAKFVFFPPWTKTLGAFLHDESRESMRACCAIGDGDDYGNIRIVPVGYERFSPVKHPCFAFAHRSHARTTGIGT